MTVSARFETLIAGVLGREGGYVNDPKDPGGETNWGITIARARASGYSGSMKDMTRDSAVVIYALYYWTQPGFDRIDGMAQEIGAKLLDIGVNMGTGVAGRFLQRSLNTLNQQSALWPDLVVDGACGAMTRAALAAIIKGRGAQAVPVLVEMITAQQSVRYMEIVEGEPDQERFMWGWQLNRVLVK